LLGLLKGYRARLGAFFFASLFYAGFHISFAQVVKLFTGVVQRRPHAWLADWSPYLALLAVIGIGTGLLALKCIFQYLRRYLEAWLAKRLVTDTQMRIAAHLLTLDLGYYQRQRAGEIVSRLTNDLGKLDRTARLFCNLVSGPLTLLAGVVFCFYTNWRLALLALVAAPIGVVCMHSLSRKMRRASRSAYQKQADATGVLMQFIAGIRTVKAFGQEEGERERFDGEMRSVFDHGMRGARAQARVRPLVELMSGAGLLIVLYVGGRWVLGGEVEFKELMGFVTALGLMYAPAKDVSNANSQVQETLPAAERVFDILRERPEIVDRPGAVELAGVREAIRFENVTFGYDPARPVLRGIDLTVNAGERVALVGPSGAGKSTLADLVARFHDPQQGAITIDGVDLRDLKLRSLLANIAIVSQDPFLFHTSIRENIAYGDPGASGEAVEAAARAAAVHEEIFEMSDGYRTVVGERGDRLSGGQRQRICIARAILKNAPILILDEATSSLDTESERKVQTALERLMEERTSLVIAHRLSTIRHADKVLVLEDGEIVSTGTHDELIREGGTYARLWALQSGETGTAGEGTP
jgi:subfamily B ATP-binding cassette protein MsbA